jgi:anti-sigma B factor antagonist
VCATWENEGGVIHLVDVTKTTTALDLEGEFDLIGAPVLMGHAQRLFDDGRNVIINLSDATFIDSSIVNALFEADAAAKRADRLLVLQFGTHPGVERVLSITEADRRLRAAKTRDEASQLIDKLSRS